jgi:hypothetical protein
MITAKDLVAAVNPKLTLLDVLDVWFVYTKEEEGMLLREQHTAAS